MLGADDDLGAGTSERRPGSIPRPECERDLVGARRDHQRFQHVGRNPPDRRATAFGGEGRDSDIRPPAERREHLTDVPADAPGSVDGVGKDADSKWFTHLDE